MKLETIKVGRIVNAHGIRGEVRVQPLERDAAFLSRIKTFYLDGAPVVPTASHVHKNLLLLKLPGVEDMNAALALKGHDLLVRREDAPLAPGECFDAELVGMAVCDAATGESLGETARQAMSNLMEQKLPDAVEEQSQISTLVAEDKLEDALRQENAAAGNTTGTAAETVMPEGTENASMDGTGNSAVDPTEENTGSVADGTSADSNVTKNTTDVTEVTEQNTTQETIQDVTQTAEPAVAETPTVEAVAQPTHYTIQRGDTLIGISLRNYGSNSKVSEICSLNGIADPDDIKIGQEILLP